MMDESEPPMEAPTATPWAGIMATLAGFGCLTGLSTLGKPALERLGLSGGNMLLAYALPTLALTFAILAGSNLHREMKKVVRATYLLGVAMLILGGDFLLLAIAALLILANLPLGRFHY